MGTLNPAGAEDTAPLAHPEDIASLAHPKDIASLVGALIADSRDARAVVETLDRDGQPRHAHTVSGWPLTIGRALDNDLVLSDPHVAAHHAAIEPTANGLAITVGDTRNGLRLGRGPLLRQGQAAPIAAEGEAVDLHLGRTHLRLRLPGHALAPEVPLAPTTPLARRAAPVTAAAAVVVAGTLFGTWLDTDPEGLGRALGNAVLALVVGAAVWCTAWALLSKTFTRQARFGWHLRVFVYASLAGLVLATLPPLLAFAFSWPVVTDFDFIGTIGVLAAALYFHLLAVEPAWRRSLRWAAAGFALVGIGLMLWFNVQRRDQLGSELYMSHLLPPALRLARPVPVDSVVDGLAGLKPLLDKKAREPAHGDEAGAEVE